MAVKARARSRDFSRQFWSVLCDAFSECFLIMMLLVIALVSYTATRLARICRIRSPCMLCSRLDQILHGKAWFSEELICATHRWEITRLSYCQSHSKLARSDDLCERCILSCSGSVGKPGNLTNTSVKEKVNPRSRSRCTLLCSCCSEPHKKRRKAHRLSDHANGSVPDDGMSKAKERSIPMASVAHSSDDGFDQLSYGGYRKLNARHDSESEIHMSDDNGDGHAMPYEARQRTRDTSCNDVQLQPMITSTNTFSTSLYEKSVPAKLMDNTPLVPLNTSTGTGNAAKSSDPAIRHGLGEIDWHQVNVRNHNIGAQSKAVPEQVCSELPKEKTFWVDIEEVGDSEGVPGSPEEGTKCFAPSTYTSTSSTAEIHISRNNSIKNTNGGRGNLHSPRWSDVISAKDTNSKTLEEVKTFLSQLSSAQGFDGPCSEEAASPRNSIQIDEYRQSDPTSSSQFLDLEPFDVHVTSEDEGEISLECLKGQYEVNRKKLSILYKELEAERSASAVAASEAMAMINRLQEEKAAMHMEALQYLRMMEEQADHDHEAIEKLNDLLTEREKEILDLEAELQNYQSRLHEDSVDVSKFDATDEDMAFRVLDNSDFMRNTIFYFEDEKAKILESLNRLEETLGMSSTTRLDLGGTNDSPQNPELECQSLLLPQEHLSSESVSSQENDENQSVEKQTKYYSCSCVDDKISSVTSIKQVDDKISSVTSIKQEISLLNSRFMALEADQKFLKQILSSLKCSNDGAEYMQEIASHLRELRRIMTEQRDRTVS